MNTIAGATAPTFERSAAINSIGNTPEPVQRALNLPDEGISPVASRWVLTPTRDLSSLDALAFGVWQMDANKFYELKGVNYDLRHHNGDVYSTVRRTPQEQLTELRSIAAGEPRKNTVNFIELDRLQDREVQVRILNLLSNPNLCTKYPQQLKNLCATCWRDYLAGVANQGFTIFDGLPEYQRTAAVATFQTLYDALETDLLECATRIHVALEKIDDKNSGKTKLTEAEFADIFNSHADLPKFRTSVEQNNTAADSGKALETIAEIMKQGNGLSAAEVQAMIDNSNREKDEEILRLRAALAQKENPEVKCGDTGGVNGAGKPCNNLGKHDGRCASHPKGDNNEQG